MFSIKFYEKYYLNKRLNRLNEDKIKEWYELSEILKEKQDIKNIILGSSHGAYGLLSSVIFNNENSINLCTDSQDLYRSYKMLEHCAEQYNLENIIITYSLFSNSYMLDLVKSEREKCYLNEVFFNIKNRDEESKYDKKYKKLIRLYAKYYLNNKYFNREYRDEYGDKIGQRIFFPNDASTETRVYGHIKHNRRNNNENIWLEKIIDLCIQKNINVSVVVMPVRNDYRQEAFKYGTFNELFNNMLQICSAKNINVISYFEEQIEDKYFGDFDHLTYDGAVFISTKLKKDMQKGE